MRFIDYTAEDVVAAVRELVPDGFDGIVDLAGGTSLRTVAPLARLALDGVLAPVVTAVHPLSDAPAALATVENGHAAGKVVIKVA